LFRLIFIDLQNVGVISAAPCITSICKRGIYVIFSRKNNKL